MSQIYHPEISLPEQIERLELEARDIRRRIEHARTQTDRRVLNRQLNEIAEQVQHLQSRLSR